MYMDCSLFILACVCVHVHVNLYASHVCRCPLRPQRASDPLKLNYQVVITYLMWVLRPEFWPSVRAL